MSSCTQNCSCNEDSEKKRYTFEEDMAIVKYMTESKRYLLAGGVKVWKEAEKLKICPGRHYHSLKERFRRVITKNLKQYNVEKETAKKITQFMKASKKGKNMIRLKAAKQ